MKTRSAAKARASTISHYGLEEQLGRGGMGVVYRSHDQRLDRKVAIKLVAEEIAGAGDQRARIMAEARAASALNHPNIVTIREVGEEAGKLFIVMELVAGETVRSQLANGLLEPKVLTRLGAQIAEVLAAAHGQGIVHGDIKPENIMVQPDGRIKLLDFGIAPRTIADTMTLTRTRIADGRAVARNIEGTLAYMSPEASWAGRKSCSQRHCKLLPGKSTLKSVEAMIWAKRGEKRRAEQLLQRALTGGKPVLHTHHMIHNAAPAYAAFGKPTQALNLLRRAIAMGLPNHPLFRDDPNLQPLHNQPSFARMIGDLKKHYRAFEKEFGQRVTV